MPDLFTAPLLYNRWCWIPRLAAVRVALFHRRLNRGKKLMNSKPIFALLFWLLLCVQQLSAATQTFNSQAAFLANAGAVATESFEDEPLVGNANSGGVTVL